ncbi:unnamed protein product [Linum tenue]|uniref:RING-type E3 ubiquitin transferase n=1 Tax=Linum tenue TaxID=586396 RepID=A0AAV0Q8Q0_9ROSI|nr:unnamed protein product [Linum tenue]
MNYWPTTALYLTAAEAAISQLSPPPPPAAAAADRRKSPSDAHDYPQELVTPSEVTILIVILSIIISVIALNCAIRCFLKDFSRDSGRRRWERKKAAELSAAVAAVTSTVKYKGGGDEEAATSASAECAICLAEFEEGEEIKVVGNCRHRFHGRCIERWFATSRNSLCPTCRQSCLPPTTQVSSVAASSPIVVVDDDG